MSKKKQGKQTKIAESPVTDKNPVVREKPYDSPVSWRFNRMDDGGCAKCTLKELHGFSNRLFKYEGLTKNEVGSLAHCHPIAVDKLTSVGKARVEAKSLEEETLYQLDLGTPVRLFGVWEGNIFHAIFLDKEHKFYKCK